MKWNKQSEFNVGKMGKIVLVDYYNDENLCLIENTISFEIITWKGDYILYVFGREILGGNLLEDLDKQ